MALQSFIVRLYVSVEYCKSGLFQIQKHRPLMAEKFLVRTESRTRLIGSRLRTIFRLSLMKRRKVFHGNDLDNEKSFEGTFCPENYSRMVPILNGKNFKKSLIENERDMNLNILLSDFQPVMSLVSIRELFIINVFKLGHVLKPNLCAFGTIKVKTN